MVRMPVAVESVKNRWFGMESREFATTQAWPAPYATARQARGVIPTARALARNRDP
jgi:hypothetical protein